MLQGVLGIVHGVNPYLIVGNVDKVPGWLYLMEQLLRSRLVQFGLAI